MCPKVILEQLKVPWNIKINCKNDKNDKQCDKSQQIFRTFRCLECRFCTNDDYIMMKHYMSNHVK
jgi:hypothetical protein